MSMHGDRSRRSAKGVIIDLTNELLHRPPCVETDAKLVLLETIASKMSWMDIFNRIRYRHRNQPVVPGWMPYKD